jgi:hypothetical protein
MRTKKARVNVLRATDVFQMSQTGSGGLRLRRADPVVLVLTPLKKRLSVSFSFSSMSRRKRRRPPDVRVCRHILDT